jgi:hypothetical protein
MNCMNFARLSLAPNGMEFGYPKKQIKNLANTNVFLLLPRTNKKKKRIRKHKKEDSTTTTTVSLSLFVFFVSESRER